MTEPRINRHTLRLAGYLAAVLAISAVTDVRTLGALWLAAFLFFARDAPAALRRALILAGPYVLVVVAAVALSRRQATGAWDFGEVGAGVALRCLLLAFVSLATIRRLNLAKALAFSWTLSTLLAVTLSQVFLYRRLIRDFALALRSRTPRRPRTSEALRSSATLTGSCLTLAVHHARDVADALRSRGL